MGACSYVCKPDVDPVMNDDEGDTPEQGQKFVEGEYVELWSNSEQSWFPGKIAKAFSVDGMDGEYEVTAGTCKVIFSGHKKYVRPEELREQLRKTTHCGICRRPAAAGFVNCCRTCAATKGRAHGPKCSALYDAAPAPPEKSAQAPRVPSEDAVEATRGRSYGPTCDAEYDAASAPPEKSPQTSRVPGEDAVEATRGRSYGPTCDAEYDAAPVSPEMSPEASRMPSRDEDSEDKRPKCKICRNPATLRFGVCCKTCQTTQGRSHGPTCDAAPPDMSPKASRVTSKDEVSGHQKPRCKICRNPATLRFGVCCKTCQTTQGRSHGPTCDAAYDAAPTPPDMSPKASNQRT